MNDLQNSPKFINNKSNEKNNKEELKEHLRKASDNFDVVKRITDKDYIDKINNIERSQCPKLNLYITNIITNSSESRVICINYLGCEESLRLIPDGIVFFGNIDEVNNESIDVILPYLQINDEKTSYVLIYKFNL